MSERVRIIQPIDLADGTCHPWSKEYPEKGYGQTLLRPGAFFWYGGKLYVGYGWLSSLHHEETPVWDPEPVPLDAVVETCCGYYHFKEVLSEERPYYRKYAALDVHYLLHPDDSIRGSLRKKIDQGTIHIDERYVLPPNCYLEAQWEGGFGGRESLFHKTQPEWNEPRNLARRIRRSPSLKIMRESPQAKKIREELMNDDACIHGLMPD